MLRSSILNDFAKLFNEFSFDKKAFAYKECTFIKNQGQVRVLKTDFSH